MNVELEALVREWHAVLLDTIAAFSTVSNSVSERAVQRAKSLENATAAWAKWGIVRPIEFTLPKRDDADAIGRVRRAVEDVTRLMARITDCLENWPVDGIREKRIHTNLAQRRRKLEGLLIEMENETWRTFYVQMNALVPSAYACAVLRVEPQRYPHAYPEPALAVMTLHAAHVPAEYAASVLPQGEFNREDAEVVVRLYNERVPSELGAALL